MNLTNAATLTKMSGWKRSGRSAAAALLPLTLLFLPHDAPAQSTWQGGPNWGDASHWTNGVPNSTSTSAIFTSNSIGNNYFNEANITVEANYSVLSLIFNKNGSYSIPYTFKGPGMLTIGSGGITNNTDERQTFNNNFRIDADAIFTSTTASGSLLITGSINVGDDLLTGHLLTVGGTGASNGSDTSNRITGAIYGTGALKKIGAGTLYLMGANTYTNDTIISAGTLQVGDDYSTTASLASNVANDGTLIFGRSNDFAYNGSIRGSGNFAKEGTGTLTLNGASTFSGGTIIYLGGITLGNSLALQNSILTYNINGGGMSANDNVLRFGSLTSATLGGLSGNKDLALSNASGGAVALTLGSGGGSSTYTGALSGTGSLTKVGGGTLTLTGTHNTYSGGTTISGGTLSLGNGDYFSVVGDIVNNGALVFNVYSGSYGGIISGTGSVTEIADTTLTLTGANTYAGTTTIVKGNLAVGISGGTDTTARLGTGTVTSNGSLTYYAGSSAGGNRIDNNFFLYFNDSSTAGSSTINNNYGANGYNVYFNNTSTAGSSILNNNDGGYVQFSGTATAGNSTINNNTVNNYGGLFFKDSSTAGDSTINTYYGNSVRFSDSSTAGNSTITSYSGGSLRFTGSSTADFATIVSNAGGMFYIQDLTSGGLTVGSLSSAGSIELGSKFLTVGGKNNSDFISGAINGSGGLTKVGTGTLLLTSSAAYSGATVVTGGTLQIGSGGTTGSIDISSGIVNNAALVFNRSNNLTYGRIISGTGSLTKSGAGTLTLTGANTFGGLTTIGGGTLTLGNSLALQNSTLSYTTSGGALNFGSLTSATLGGLSGSKNLALASTGGAVALTVGKGGASTLYSGVLSGTGSSVTKTGSGTLTLTGANTYTGGTSITGGTLLAASLGSVNNTLPTLNGGQFGLSQTGTLSNNFVLGAAGSGFAAATGTTTTLSGIVSGAQALTIGNPNSATGTVILTNTGNTYSGGTSITGGTLLVPSLSAVNNTLPTLNGGQFGLSQTGTLSNNFALGAAGSGFAAATGTTTTLSGSISGANGLTIGNSGGAAGTVVLAGANNVTGVTTINAGTLQIGSGITLQNTTLAYNTGGGTLSFGTLTNASLAGLSGSKTLVLSNALSGAVALTLGGNNTTSSFDGILSGSGSLTKLGTGTLTLTGYNTYTGATTVNAGTLLLNATPQGSGNYGAALASNSSGLFINAGGTVSLGQDFQLPLVLPVTLGDKSGANVATLNLNGHTNLLRTVTLGDGALVTGGFLIMNGQPAEGATASLTVGANDAATVASNIGIQGDLTTNVGANGSLALSNLSDWYYAGTLTKTGTGTLTLTGANTYSGGTTISAGTLRIGNGGTTGSVAGNIVNNAALVFNQGGYNTIYGGVISGTGSFTKIGTAQVTLTGANTYSGDTTVSAGTLQIGIGNSTGTSLKGTFTNNGGLFLGGITTADNATIVNNAGATLDISSLAFNRSGITVGALSGAGNVSLGTKDLSVGALNTDTTISGNITGMSGSGDYGSLIKVGTGTLTLAGTATLPGGLTINKGAVSLGNGGTTGSVTGSITINNNGNLIFNRSDDVTYSGNLGGDGSLTKMGAGTLTLTGNKNGSGTTTITDGTLSIGNGRTTGSVTGNIVNNATLIFNRSNNLTYGTYDGIISGTGNLTKLGNGTLTLSGVNTFSGTTNVGDGTLKLGSSLALQNSTLATTGGGTFSFGSLSSATLGGLSGSQNLVLKNTVNGPFSSVDSSVDLTVGGNNTDTTYSGSLSGDDSTLTKVGTGTLTLTGSNDYGSTYSGLSPDTIISAGTLQIGNGGTTGSLATGITNNAALVFNRSDNVTHSNVITGTGSLTKLGAGTLTLSGSNTYTGTTTIGAGTLSVGSTGALQNTILIYNTGDGTLSFGTRTSVDLGGLSGNKNLALTNTNNAAVALYLGGSNASTTYDGILSGSGSLTKEGTGTFTLTGATTYSGATTISAGTLSIGSGGTNGSVAGNIVDNAALVFNQSDDVVYGGIISGTGSLTQAGTGTLTMTGNNTFTGGAVINSGGTLSIGNGGTTGDIDGNLIVNNGTLVFNRSDNVTYTSSISGTGSLTKSGAGTLTLGNTNTTNTFSGTTTISAGTLTLGGGNALRNSTLVYNTGSGSFSFGTLSSASLGGLFGDKNLALLNTSSGSKAVALTIGNGGASSSYSGVLSGTGSSLTKTGTGTLTLTGANTYTGGTTITGGTLLVPSLSAVNNTLPTINGGRFGLSQTGTLSQNFALGGAGSGFAAASGTTTTLSGSISGTQGLTIGNTNGGAAGTVVLAGANTYTGGTTINAGTLSIGNNGITGNIVNNGALVFNRTNSFAYNSVISGTGSLTLMGGGAFTLNGVNTFSGITTVSGSVLTLGNSQALKNSTVNYVNGGSLSFGTLTSASLGGLSGSQNLSLSNTSSGAVALTVGGGNTDTTYTGTLSGSGSLTKVGTGTLVLSSSSTYTGATVVSGGTLQVGAAHPALGDYSTTFASSPISVGANSTLIGNGTFGTASTVNGVQVGSTVVTVSGSGARLQGNGLYGAIKIGSGATIAAGNSIGQISGTSLVVDGGTTFEFDLGAGGQSDLIALSGAFNSSSTGNFTFAFDTPGGELTFDTPYTLITFTSTNFTQSDVQNRFVAAPRGNISNIQGSWTLTGNSLQYTLQDAEVTPEPASILLLLPGLCAGAMGMQLLRRREKRI